MNKNTHVETAQKGQATNKNTQPEKVVTALKNIDDIRKNKSKVPTGKVTLLKESETRKKTREEQYRNFRINALKRRCKRMGFDDEKTAQYVEALKKQLDAPKEYSILVIFSSKDSAMMKEALTNADINYKYHGDTYYSIDGDQNVLAKIREIAPPGAKVHPYAKKMESVIPKEEKEVIKKPSNNTAEKKAAVKTAKKNFGGSYRYARRQKGRIKTLADLHRASRYVKKNLKKGEKIDVKKVFKVAEERKKGGAATTVQLKAKKGSTAPKKASTPIKKAA